MGTYISSKADIETMLENERPDVVLAGLASDVVEAIQDEDHPDYGSDWDPWLAEHLNAIVESAFDAREPA